MEKQQITELKKAILKMDQVVMAMPYHTKLKIAWKGLKKVIAPAMITAQPQQGKLDGLD